MSAADFILNDWALMSKVETFRKLCGQLPPLKEAARTASEALEAHKLSIKTIKGELLEHARALNRTVTVLMDDVVVVRIPNAGRTADPDIEFVRPVTSKKS